MGSRGWRFCLHCLGRLLLLELHFTRKGTASPELGPHQGSLTEPTLDSKAFTTSSSLRALTGAPST